MKSTSAFLLCLSALVGCTTTPGSRPSAAHGGSLRVGPAHASANADPRWNEASETLEHLSVRCDQRRSELERRARSARATSDIASVVAVVVILVGETADSGGSPDGLIVGEARCRAPAGPTSSLPAADQEAAIPCGGMSAAGGGGPIAQRAIRRQLTLDQLVEAMHEEIEASLEWLRVRRELAAWTDDDIEGWQIHESNLRSLCIE